MKNGSGVSRSREVSVKLKVVWMSLASIDYLIDEDSSFPSFSSMLMNAFLNCAFFKCFLGFCEMSLGSPNQSINQATERPSNQLTDQQLFNQSINRGIVRGIMVKIKEQLDAQGSWIYILLQENAGTEWKKFSFMKKSHNLIKLAKQWSEKQLLFDLINKWTSLNHQAWREKNVKNCLSTRHKSFVDQFFPSVRSDRFLMAAAKSFLKANCCFWSGSGTVDRRPLTMSFVFPK
jgi:hypothetical protein